MKGKFCINERHMSSGTTKVQTWHPRRLFSGFFIRFLVSIISKLGTRKKSIFYLVSVADETNLSIALLDIPKTGFVTWRPIL